MTDTAASPRRLSVNLDLSRLRRRPATPALAPHTPVPTRSAFDLLEGSFAAARNTRRLNIGLALVAVIAAVYLLGVSAVDYVVQSQDHGAIALDQQSVASLNAKISAVTAGGQTPDAITSHHKQRLGVVSAIDAQSVDLATVYAGLVNAAPGDQITSLTVTPPTAPSSSSGSTTPTAPAPKGYQISVSYALPSAQAVLAVQSSLNRLPFIVAGSTQFQGTIGGGLAGQQVGSTLVTFTATLNQHADVTYAKGL